jgi:pimeloyl-ACP methyl ester carboxylesterase
MQLPPLEADLPPEALRVLALSTRLTTPCGDGEMVWHAWGDGEPLLLLHGGGGSWTHWLRNVEALAATGRRVLVPDLPGCGDSARPPNHGQDADAIVAPLAEGLRAMTGGAACDVVAFSFGSLVAVLFTAAQPALVKRLIVMGAPGLGLRNRRLPLVPWRGVADPVALEAAHRQNLATWMLHRPESIDAQAIALHAANLQRDRLLKRRLALTTIVLETLPEIRCRLDAIYGGEESLYRDTLARIEPLLKTAPRFGELVFVPGAGHWVQYEEPEVFNRELVRLLAG